VDHDPDEAPGAVRHATSRLRWFWLIALVGGVLVVFAHTPEETTLLLVLGPESQRLREVHLSCEDSEGLSSGGRWNFDGPPYPMTISHRLLTKGAQLRCEITLRSPHQSEHCTRVVDLRSSEVRLHLGAALRKLR